MPSWQIAGDYFETCSCDYLCPCVPMNLAGRPTKGWCNFAMVFRIDTGHSESVTLDGMAFAVVGHAPEVMGKGNWSIGIIVDDRASADQKHAIATIASGMAGGPPSILAGVVNKVLGVESAPIQFSKQNMRRSVRIPKLLEIGCEGVPGGANPKEPLSLDNTMHPANSRLALAKSAVSRMHVFGLNWEDTSGNNNGFFAPFNWSN